MIAYLPVIKFMYWVDDEMPGCVSALAQLIGAAILLVGAIWLVQYHGYKP